MCEKRLVLALGLATLWVLICTTIPDPPALSSDLRGGKILVSPGEPGSRAEPDPAERQKPEPSEVKGPPIKWASHPGGSRSEVFIKRTKLLTKGRENEIKIAG